MPTRAPLVLLVATEDWYFWMHWSGLAQTIQKAGFRVALASRFTLHRERIEALGIECIPVPIRRSLRHPVFDLRTLLALRRLIKADAPALVHLIALKPVLLSMLSVLSFPATPFVLALAGMGYVFASADGLARMVQIVVRPALCFLLGRPNTFAMVQNADDLALLGQMGVDTTNKARLLPGVGVDVATYQVSRLPSSDAPIVLLPARMLRAKGVSEFAAAAIIVRERHPTVRFVLAGGLDVDNPDGYSRSELETLVARAGIEWWGLCEDMPAVYRQASIVCLPSFYREGVPTSLVEGAASGRPLVSTNTPGCRDICRDGISGKLVPPRAVAPLAEAISGLLSNREEMTRLGDGGRKLVEREFGADVIHSQTLACYSRLGLRFQA
jgi:glycosyltransferase involved in cell wall biosynthesis